MALAKGGGIVVVIRPISRFLVDQITERRWRETVQAAVASSIPSWRSSQSSR
jgi:hypothetical protein